MAYINMVGQFIYETPTLRYYFDQLAENDSTLKSNGWQDSVKVVFYQAAVPTGWTQDVSANDKFLRVVNNTGDNPGGAVGGSLSVAAGLTLAHTHSNFSTDGNHTHSGITNHTHAMGRSAVDDQFGVSGSPIGSGDVLVDEWTLGGSATTRQRWLTQFNASPTDVDASSAAGSHNHTVPSSLSNIQPAYTDIIIGIKATSSGYTDLTAFFNHNDRVRYEPFNNAGGLWFNDEFNEDRLTPFGTISVFYNAVAPTGWNKLTTQNDKALRIVSGAGGGVGGSLGTGQTITLLHTHVPSSNGTHSHTVGSHRHNVDQAASAATSISTLNTRVWVDSDDTLRPNQTNVGSPVSKNVVRGRTTKTGGGVSSGTDPNHTHTMASALSNIILAYVDVIQCQKLSTGAPFAYASLLNLVVYKKLVTKQRLDSFAQNDEYIRYHTTPAGSVMAFYQSTTPLNWSLLNAQHDKVMRVVSGAGGGSGGNQLISNAIVLQHTHAIAAYNHNHSYPSHQHVFQTQSEVITHGTTNWVVGTTTPSGIAGMGSTPGASTPNRRKLLNTSLAVGANTTDYSHNHGGVSSSALSNVTFAYANVILCQKN